MEENIKKVDESRVREMINDANIEQKSEKVIKEFVKDQTMETKEREKDKIMSSFLNYPNQNHN